LYFLKIVKFFFFFFFFFTIILQDHESVMLRVGALAGVRIDEAGGRHCGYGLQPWSADLRNRGSSGDTTLKSKKLLFGAGECFSRR
jgi:hypothetical protein